MERGRAHVGATGKGKVRNDVIITSKDKNYFKKRTNTELFKGSDN